MTCPWLNDPTKCYNCGQPLEDHIQDTATWCHESIHLLQNLHFALHCLQAAEKVIIELANGKKIEDIEDEKITMAFKHDQGYFAGIPEDIPLKKCYLPRISIGPKREQP
jgi:hypothetical protein